MAGHSRPKGRRASHAYVPAIHVFDSFRVAKTWMRGSSPRMTDDRSFEPRNDRKTDLKTRETVRN